VPAAIPAARNRLPIASGTLPDDPGINPVAEGVVHHAQRALPFNFHADCDRVRGIVMYEIGRAIQRVKNPAYTRTARIVRTFFAKNAVLWAHRTNDSNDLLFCCAVNLRDQISSRGFGVDAEPP
jgi:hypothetical protein